MKAPEARLSHRPGKLSSHTLKAASVASLALILAGCATQGGGFSPVSTTSQHGYVVSPFALEQVPVGSSRDQVLIALGSPSTKANYGGEVFYYISQTRYRAANFMRQKVVGQTIVAVYFDDTDAVERIANYTLKDGVVFDSISRTTPTGGGDANFLREMLGGLLRGGSGGPFGS